MNTPSSLASVHHTLAVRNVHAATEWGGVVFSGTTESGHNLRVVASPKALPRVPVVGESWLVEGHISHHAQFGPQVQAKSCRYTLPRGRLIIQFLVDHPDFAGIGDRKAKKLWKTFGDQLLPTLSAGDVSALEGVLTRPMAQRLIEAWATKEAEAEIVDFLDRHGFDPSMANKLRRVWGDKTIDMLELNPYYLLAFANWGKVDGVATKLGIATDDERRLVGAVESALYDRLEAAHTLTDHDDLVSMVNRKLRRTLAERAIDLALEEQAIVGSKTAGYQTQGAEALERGIADRIRGMLAGETPTQQSLFAHDADSLHLQRTVEECESEQGFPLNDEQRHAVEMPLNHAFCLLTGGAGVGKTSVLRVVIRLAEVLHLSVYQMALAGRAAKRMAEATGYEAMTIAKFLFSARSQKLKLAADSLVIVDESSMLDLPTLYRILRQLPDGAKLMLVGDPAQLPPIGFGLVFHRMVGSTIVPQSHLLTTHRQAAATGIPTAAEDVRAHTVPELKTFTGKACGVSFIECAATGVIDALQSVAKSWLSEDFQILAATNDGPSSIRSINRYFHGQALSAAPSEYQHFALGEPVIHLFSDPDRCLLNGTLGRISGIQEGFGITIDFEGEEHYFSNGELVGRVELAYAISVHKAQGSQFKRVAIVIAKSRLLDHALVYTALTRGVEQVTFIGDRTGFEAAIVNPPLAYSRQVAFSL